MPVRITWPAARWPQIKRPPQIVTCSIQRLCGHYDRLPMFARHGWSHEIAAEQRLLCFGCRTVHTPQTLLAQEPRLRIHHEGAIWGVERLMGHTLAYEIVAFLSSLEECLEWIATTFADRQYVILPDVWAGAL